ncbi:MAG: hypothetical protein B6D36_18120 [Planctomycetes bacterium UTPLA1]|nr:MAG: hypothetical protein B6D36_18120 [Planctomycetes bacterium UTPLA1]
MIAKMRPIIGSTLVLALSMNASVQGDTHYVKAGATGTGDNWMSPSGDLQGIINASGTNDEVWVASGTYTPGTSSSDYFSLKNTVRVRGGFFGTPGSEGDPNARDINPFTNNTILSGDIGIVGDKSDNCEIVVYANSSLTASTVLDGFSITEGIGSLGAGMQVVGGSNPSIVNCRFVNNGRVNIAEESFGGAINFVGNSAAILVDCIFENNRARLGGAIWLQPVSGDAPTIQRCTFKNNVAYWRGGAIENLNSASPNLQVRECRFVENVTYAAEESNKGGGAISNDGGIATLINCVFYDNESAHSGGAIYNFSSGTLTLRSCTFSENTAAWLGGGIWMQNGTMTLRNTVLWSNHDKDGTANDDSQFTVNSGTTDVKYSCLQDDAPGGSIPFGSGSPNFNIDTDPVFINPPVGNLRMGSASSGCVDTGNNSDVSGVSTDIDGRMRIMDTTVDRGAHESAFTLSGPTDCDSNSTADDVEIAADPSKDCNNNGILDICDVTPIGSGADCNSNGVPDDCDIASGTSFDCNTNGVPDDCEFEDCNHDCIDDSGQSLDDCDENESADVCEIAPPKRWTTDEDFEEGIFINSSMFGTTGVETGLRKNPPDETSCLPYIWVPGSGRGTVLLIRSDETPSTGNEQDAIKGEYRTGPVYHKSMDNGSLSPTTRNPLGLVVDLDGSVWITNYGDRGSPFTGIRDSDSMFDLPTA